MARANLANLDALPAGCTVLVELDAEAGRVRFQAVDAAGRESCWSGWFPVADAPIRLAWRAFDFGED